MFSSSRPAAVRHVFFCHRYYQTNEKPNKTALKNYFRKLLSARSLFTVSLPPSDNLVHLLCHTGTMNLFKYSIM